MELSEREKELFGFLVRYKEAHGGNSPTHKEMVRGVGWKSTGDTHKYLRRLAAKGVITTKRHSIHIVGEHWDSGWIEVRDRLPRNGQEVLTYWAAENTIDRHTFYVSHGGATGPFWMHGWQNHSLASGRITHWKPLPPAPDTVDTIMESSS